MERLVKELKRSVSYIRVLIGRYNIQKTRFKISKKIAYNIPKEIMQEIRKYNARCQKHTGRTKKNDKRA